MTPVQFLTDQKVSSRPAAPDPTATPREPTISWEDQQWGLSQIKPLLELNDNWDGYGACAPDATALSHAFVTLGFFSWVGFRQAPDVMPIRDGSVNLTWVGLNDKMFEIEFRPGDRITYTANEQYKTVSLGEVQIVLDAASCFFSNNKQNVA